MNLISKARRRIKAASLSLPLILGGVLTLAAFLGQQPSARWLALLIAGIGGIALLARPVLGLPALVFAALVVPLEFGTGTEVVLNAVTALVPVSLAVWAIDMVRRGQFRIASSRVNLPLMLFLVAGLFSLLIGSATWDPAVPRSSQFLLVQLAQWAVFAFAAGAFWLTANLISDRTWLRRLTFVYLALAASVAILRVVPWGATLTHTIATIAVNRAPFWTLLAAVAGGQILFNRRLTTGWWLLLMAALVSVLVYAFVLARAAVSIWVGVAAVLGVLAWLRWPRMRWPAILLLTILSVGGFLSSAVYDFAGGDAEWVESGGSRLALIRRVIEVTMRNPITGLGPAAYRPYTRMEPLLYGRAFWVEPTVSSHNNYVDLFSHVGLLGLGLFLWFAGELILLGLRLRTRFTSGFEAGYVNGMLAAWAGALVLMLLADWILPFVYNIGFPGFQASVLVWLLLGGLVALEHIDASPDHGGRSSERSN